MYFYVFEILLDEESKPIAVNSSSPKLFSETETTECDLLYLIIIEKIINKYTTIRRIITYNSIFFFFLLLKTKHCFNYSYYF